MNEINNNKSSADEFTYIGLVLIIIFAAIWYFVGNEIKYFYLYYKLVLIKLVSLFYINDDIVNIIQFIEKTPISEITLNDLSNVGNFVNSFINIPAIALLFYLAYTTNKNIIKLNQVHSMQSLAKSEVNNWPYIAPVINRDIAKQPLFTGKFAMAKKPYDYAVKHKILKDIKDLSSLDKSVAEKVFASQLGKPISSFEEMKPQEKAIFLILASFYCDDDLNKPLTYKHINNLAFQASKISTKRMPDFTDLKELEKYLNNPYIKDVIKTHSYAYTMIIELYTSAKSRGVLPSSYFVWLKPRDRKLWYVLNCVGRKVSFVEVSGIFSHYKLEMTLNKSLPVPFVKTAIKGLEIALTEIILGDNSLKPKSY